MFGWIKAFRVPAGRSLKPWPERKTSSSLPPLRGGHPPPTMEAPFRLHISGLAPTTKPADLISRFTSFGTVIGDVGGLGLDANGFPRTFAFVTLETTPAKLAKCTSMLSGSMWKGHKLRIAIAKPDYTTRMAAEREALKNGSAKGPKRKKRKPNPDPNVGEVARRWELVTTENCQKHSGWTVDPNPVPFPLFPLLTRPSHPLPALPSKAPATSWTRETLRAKSFREKKEAKRLAAPPVQLLRARRVRIDPRKWGRTKIVFDEDAGAGMAWGIKGAWECVEDEDEELPHKSSGEARWVFKAPDGSIKRSETVQLGRSAAYTDSFKSLLDALAGPSAPVTARPTFATDIEIPGELDTAPRERAKSLSPPPYVSLAPRTLLYNDEDAFALRTTTLDETEAEELRETERLKQLDVLKALIGEALKPDVDVDVVPDPAARAKPAVEGFGDEDDEEAFQEVLRLRGGGGDESERDSDDDGKVLRLRGGGGDESEEESDDEDDDDEEGEPTTEVDTAAAAKTTLSMGTLKDMFKPQEATSSFSLLTGLDLELDPLERTPSPEPTSYPVYRAPAATIAGPRGSFVPPPALEGRNRAWIGTGPLTPFFAFPSGKFEAKDGSMNPNLVEGLGVPVEVVENAARESAKRLGEAAQAFWRSESAEKIEEEHQKLRESLRGHARKRHREAAKRGRKKTAGRRVGGGGNDGQE